jgi:thiol-disulfide isomerase/thioredoxin
VLTLHRALALVLLCAGLALPPAAVAQDEPAPAPGPRTEEEAKDTDKDKAKEPPRKANEPPTTDEGDAAPAVKPDGKAEGKAEGDPAAQAQDLPRRPLLVGAEAPETLQLAPVADGAKPDAEPVLVPLTSIRGENKKALVVLFWSPDCPVCKRYVNPYAALAKTFDGVTFVVVAADNGPAPSEVAKTLKEAALAVPVYADPGDAAAKQLGVRVAPTALLFDAAGVLRYRGPLDDDRKAKNREPVPYLKSALAAIVAGKDVESSEPRPFGSALRKR